jgi:putative tryptophan/tyrosine transport system substrate-binding protein
MKRREFIATAAAALFIAPRRSGAQGKPRRIGFLGRWADEPERDPSHAAWLNGLREKGWIDGKNLLVEYRDAAGRLPALAADLVALVPELIIASGPNPALALKAATTTIPIVFLCKLVASRRQHHWPCDLRARRYVRKIYRNPPGTGAWRRQNSFWATM